MSKNKCQKINVKKFQKNGKKNYIEKKAKILNKCQKMTKNTKNVKKCQNKCQNNVKKII
jgi:hypothetical protein